MTVLIFNQMCIKSSQKTWCMTPSHGGLNYPTKDEDSEEKTISATIAALVILSVFMLTGLHSK